LPELEEELDEELEELELVDELELDDELPSLKPFLMYAATSAAH